MRITYWKVYPKIPRMINLFSILILSSLTSLLFCSKEISYADSKGETQEYDPDFRMPQSAMAALFPTTFDEHEEVFAYKGVPCAECKDNYDGPCPLHVLKHVHERPKPHHYMHRRAEKTAPKNILKLEESSIPGAGVGMWAIKKIPKDVVFGPLDGRVYEKEDNVTVDGNFWRIPGTDNTYIDLMDKSKANYLAYINCARNVKEQNLDKYFNETDKKFYFISKRSIPQYSELLTDYGTEFRKTIGINDLDFNRSRDLKNRGAPCLVCNKVYHNIGYLLLSHQNKCRETYDRLVKDTKDKPHRVYRRGRYKMIQFKHDWRTTVSTAASSDWIMQFYNEQPPPGDT